MPKIKTHSGFKKRFTVNCNGKVKHKQCGKRHNLSKKSSKRIAELRKSDALAPSHANLLLRSKAPYQRKFKYKNK
jgi:large subunit ribosomal protein L35